MAVCPAPLSCVPTVGVVNGFACEPGGAASSGAPQDAGPVPDAGDAGRTNDAGPGNDAGPVIDAGALPDGGGHADAGPLGDAGPDAGSPSCALGGPIAQFEPTPPGLPRPSTLNWIDVDGFWLYQPPGVAPRLLIAESFGYQVVDLTNPATPQAVDWEDYRFQPTNPGPIPCDGDCHSSIMTFAISPDGARLGLGLESSQSSGYSTVIGATATDGLSFTLEGDMPPIAGYVALQHLGARYLAYGLSYESSKLHAADVTTLPGLSQLSIAAEDTGLNGGVRPIVAGAFLVYMEATSGALTTGVIDVVDISAPGPIGSISAGLSSVSLAVSDWQRPAGDTPLAFSAAADPSDPAAVYVLAEFATAAYHSAGFSLIRLANGVKGTPVTFALPTLPAETWGTSYSPVLVQASGQLFAMMWAMRTAPTPIYRLFSVPVSGLGTVTPGSFDVDPSIYQGFSTGYPIAALAASGMVYLYVPSGQSGWVVPLACGS